MTTFGNDILGFNRDFNVKAVYYNNILRNAGLPGLTKKGLVTTYSIKLCGPAKLYLDLVLRLRASNNAEQVIDSRTPTAYTIREGFAEIESFALQAAGDHLITMPVGLPTASAVATDTVPIDLDMLLTEILATLYEGSAGRERGKGRMEGKCWGCRGSGHFRQNCLSSMHRRMHQKKETPSRWLRIYLGQLCCLMGQGEEIVRL
jgi:hypothetical protein